MKTIDLHVHSTYSDGTLTPEELVILAKKQNLSAMALTDHDTVAGVSEAIAAGKKHNIEIVPGIELSCLYHTTEIHILGLLLDYTNVSLRHHLNELQEKREERNLRIIQKFHEHEIPLSYEEMKKKYGNAIITRAHFADYLLEKGFIHSRNEAFERYLGDHCSCYVPKEEILPENIIRLIRTAGGIPILAHPILYHLGNSELLSLVDSLCESGLMGIEAIYSSYTIGEELQIRQIATSHHLLLSGGSDYHGANKPHLNLGTGRGNLTVPYTILSKLKEIKQLNNSLNT